MSRSPVDQAYSEGDIVSPTSSASKFGGESKISQWAERLDNEPRFESFTTIEERDRYETGFYENRLYATMEAHRANLLLFGSRSLFHHLTFMTFRSFADELQSEFSAAIMVTQDCDKAAAFLNALLLSTATDCVDDEGCQIFCVGPSDALKIMSRTDECGTAINIPCIALDFFEKYHEDPDYVRIVEKLGTCFENCAIISRVADASAMGRSENEVVCAATKLASVLKMQVLTPYGPAFRTEVGDKIEFCIGASSVERPHQPEGASLSDAGSCSDNMKQVIMDNVERFRTSSHFQNLESPCLVLAVTDTNVARAGVLLKGLEATFDNVRVAAPSREMMEEDMAVVVVERTLSQKDAKRVVVGSYADMPTLNLSEWKSLVLLEMPPIGSCCDDFFRKIPSVYAYISQKQFDEWKEQTQFLKFLDAFMEAN